MSEEYETICTGSVLLLFAASSSSSISFGVTLAYFIVVVFDGRVLVVWDVALR